MAMNEIGTACSLTCYGSSYMCKHEILSGMRDVDRRPGQILPPLRRCTTVDSLPNRKNCCRKTARSDRSDKKAECPNIRFPGGFPSFNAFGRDGQLDRLVDHRSSVLCAFALAYIRFFPIMKL